MTNEKMTVHRALADLKTMDDRINKAIGAVPYVMAVKHSAEKINGVPVNEFKEKMKSNYQKVMDLIARRDAMKRAIVLSNAITKIKIGSKEYTVAEAIDMKNHSMEFRASLLRMASYNYDNAQNELNKNSGEALEKRAEQYVLSVIQAQPKDSKMSVDSEAMKALRKTYLENNAYDLIDPLNIVKVIEDLRNQIDEFAAEIDAALSVSNALTVVEFEY